MAKHAAHESYRASYLFKAEREKDTELHCALGVKCRDCPILKTIEKSINKQREGHEFYDGITDQDIDHAKIWTCLGHVMHSKSQGVTDGAFFYRKGEECGL